jgi:NAD(P)H-hydrate epimerase
VVDADGLRLLAASGLVHHGALGAHVVLTPHDGEFAALSGHPPGPDRIGATRALARSTGAVVLLKGPTTVVAAPTGDTLLSTSGDTRLATAGTGDVLAGMVASLCAQGVSPFHAAAMAAYGHGRAADLGWPVGLVASDLPGLVPAAVAAMGVAFPGAPPDTDDDGQELTC